MLWRDRAWLIGLDLAAITLVVLAVRWWELPWFVTLPLAGIWVGGHLGSGFSIWRTRMHAPRRSPPDFPSQRRTRRALARLLRDHAETAEHSGTTPKQDIARWRSVADTFDRGAELHTD